MSIYSDTAHTETQETRFIDSLRTKQLIEGYIRACEKRVDWAGMNKAKIVRYAKQRLLKLKD